MTQQTQAISQESSSAEFPLLRKDQIVDLLNNFFKVALVGSSASFSASKYANVEDQEAVDLLGAYNKIVKLHYRMNYNIFRVLAGETFKADRFEIILNDALKVKSSKLFDAASVKQDRAEYHQLLELTLTAVIGVCSYYLDDKDFAEKQLIQVLQSSNGTELESIASKYRKMLKLESYFFLNLLGKVMSQFTLSSILKQGIPQRTEAVSVFYLDLTIRQFTNYTTENNKFIKMYGDILCNRIQSAELLAMGELILSQASFPKADEANNFDLESFHYVLTFFYNFGLKDFSKWEAFMEKSISLTFQSIVITHSAALFYNKMAAKQTELKGSSTKLSLLHFENLLVYSGKYRQLHDNEHSDIVSSISLYEHMLEIFASQENINSKGIGQIFSASSSKNKQARNFVCLLKEFYQNNEIPLVSLDEAKYIDSNKLVNTLILPHNLTNTLSKSWLAIYSNFKDSLKTLLSGNLLFYLANSLQLHDSKDVTEKIDILYEFAYCLATQREAVMASKFLKSQILNRWPENSIKSWLLLCLLESRSENKSNAFKISSTVLESINDRLEQLTFEDKWYAIQTKLTQLSLIQEMFSVQDALELLPELFSLFQSLFEQEKNVEGYTIKRSKEYLLQSIWLFVANLYSRDANSFSDANESVKESENVENVQYTNLNINIARGYLDQDPRSFERVIRHDPFNTDALVGLAQYTFETLIPDDTKPVFSPESNNTLSDLKLKLELCLENSIEGHFCPELWFYLSKIYDIYNDHIRMESALLNCIKYEEENPIRDFKHCRF
ncbi:hypothetical protein ACO0RG_000715 [Hanseniaspora osmophila]